MNNTEMPDEIYVEHSADEWVNGKYVPLYEGGETWAGGKTKYIRADKAAPDVNAELLEALKAAKWKVEPSGNLEKGWVTTASGQRFTSLGSRKMYGKFLEEHNKQIDYIIARAKQKGQSHE